MFDTYDNVIENGVWLEDAGKYSRYGTDIEESTWVCHECGCIEADPDFCWCDCEDESHDAD